MTQDPEVQDLLKRLRVHAENRDAADLIESLQAERDQLTGEVERLKEKLSPEELQKDLAAILRHLGLGDHARPASPHEVFQTEVLPAIERLVR